MTVNSLPLLENVEALKKGNMDLKEYIKQICQRIDKLEPIYQTLIPERDRRARLLKEAEELEKKFPPGKERPPLFGVLVGVKDIFSVAGFPTKAGSKLPSQLFAGPEAICVEKLKAAGALILGKTVTTEFAYFSPGPTKNPHNPEHTPGGSSSGSAAAVALGFCPLALGTQTIGSVIRPAAYCGIVGFKPSFDRIPTGGLVYFSINSDHVGLFTQDVAGMELAASLLCTEWNPIEKEAPPLPLLGVPEGPYLAQAGEEALEFFERQIKELIHKGFQMKRVKVLENIEEINERHRQLGAAEMARVHEKWFSQYSNLYSKHTREVYEKGKNITDGELASLREKGPKLRNSLQDIMDKEAIDVWISPSAIDTAPRGLASTGNPIMNLPWTHAGMPVVNLPLGKGANGLPLGLQVTGRYWQDERLLKWAAQIGEKYGIS